MIKKSYQFILKTIAKKAITFVLRLAGCGLIAAAISAFILVTIVTVMARRYTEIQVLGMAA